MKKLLSLITVMFLIMTMLLTAAFADGESAQIPHVFDTIGLLTQDQTSALESTAASLSAENNCALYIVIIDDYSKYSRSMSACAEDMYNAYGLGWDNGNGEEHRDSLLLLISMNDRDYCIDTCGFKGNEIFNNPGITALEGALIPYLRNNDWYGGFSAYLAEAGELFKAPLKDNDVQSPYASESYGYEKPAGYDPRPAVTPGSVIITVLIPCLIAAIVCGIFKKQMKTAVEKTEANDYVSRNSFVLTAQQDMFVNRTVTREIINTDSGSRGSGGGGGHYSGGHSGHSGKF